MFHHHHHHLFFVQDKDEHLDLLEGVLIDLLKTKWNVFVKAKFYSQFYMFSIYFFISMFAFGLRPRAYDGKNGDDDDNDSEGSANSTRDATKNDTTNAPVKSLILHNLTEILCNYSATYQESIMQTELGMMNVTDVYDNITSINGDDFSDEWASFSECPLLDISTLQNRVSELLRNWTLYLLFMFHLDQARR
jgi:hypothetical protein